MSSDQLYPSRLVLLNDQFQNYPEAIEVSTEEFTGTDNSPIYRLKYDNVTIFARYRIKKNNNNKNGFLDVKEVESFKFFLMFMVKYVENTNKRISPLTKNKENEKELNQPSGPKWIFCSYPFIWVVDYNKETRMYQPHSIINVERRRTECGKKHDSYDDIINAYLLIHPGCKRYDCDYSNLTIPAQLSNPVIQVTRNGKNIPYLPAYENRCLWCGCERNKSDSDENRRWSHYCSDSCKYKDKDFTRVFEERLCAADADRILSLYQSYLKTNGRWGESLTTEEIENQTIDSIITAYHLGTIPHAQIMSWIRGPCRECGKEIPLNKATNARYCSRECSNKGRKREWWQIHHPKKDSGKLHS